MSDIVGSEAEADGLPKPPLIVLDRVRAFLDEHGLGSGELRAVRIGEGGGSNFTFLLERDSGRYVLRRPPRPPLPPSAHDVVREARLQLALREAGFTRLPTIVAVCEDESLLGVPFYVMEELEGDRADRAAAAGSRVRGEPTGARRRPRRRARRDPCRRRDDARACLVRAAGELQRAPGPTLRAAVGDQQDARSAGGRRRRDAARCDRARATSVDGRARRLPARKHDGRPRRSDADRGRAGLGDGGDRRPARGRRLPARDLQRAGRTPEPARDVTRDRAPGLSLARRPRRAVRSS